MEIQKIVKVHYFLVLYTICIISAVFSATDTRDFAILDDFRKGLSNPELLKWPVESQDPCGELWPYVYCLDDRISKIKVSDLGLSGSLSQNINKLERLSYINLARNNFSGKLPVLRGLSYLKFAFFDDNHFDTIPSDFFIGLASLKSLTLGPNPLNKSTGWMLPLDLLSSYQLQHLSVTACNLAGPLPDFLGRMYSLEILKMSYNRLTGEIPHSFSQLNLQTLLLNNQRGSGLSGSLDVIVSMTRLTHVLLNGNQFSGPIPRSIGAMKSLTKLFDS